MHLNARSLTKSFGSLMANDRVSFEVKSGEILGLIGENGAGKSTSMNMLFGYLQPDDGQILIDDKPAVFANPRDAIAAGVGMVHQHFVLAPAMTAFEHLRLASGPMAKDDQVRSRATELMREIGFEMNLDQPVGQLEVGRQQQLEILRVLYQGAKILILDEPTAVLSPVEVEPFLIQIQKLSRKGHGIILISHKLDEVLRVCQNIVVMRHGRVVHRCAQADATIESLAAAMVGDEAAFSEHHSERDFERDFEHDSDRVHDVHPARLTGSSPEAPATAETALHVSDFRQSGGHSALDLSFDVKCGEIVGIAGVEGNGQEELFDAILRIGKANSEQGSILINGRDITQMSSDRLRRSVNIGVLPFDRCSQGLLVDESATFNLLLSGTANCRAPWWIDWRALLEKQRQLFRDHDILPLNHEGPVGRMSGGNQQKFVVARELESAPQLILAAHPTRGVDWRSSGKIHGRLLHESRRGAGVLVVSSDVSELMKISDRILVMLRGKVSAEFKRDPHLPQGFDFKAIGLAMTGGARK